MDPQTVYWWAPDESAIVYTRVDESTVDEVERFEIYASTVKVVRQRYPAAGRPNARINVFVALLRGGGKRTEHGLEFESRALPAADPGEGYLARVHWLPDSRAIAVQRQSRDQRQLELLRVELASGTGRRLLEERSDTWVDLHDELTFLRQRGGFIWASMRNGYRHLYLHAEDVTLLRPLTAGEWTVAGDAGERAIQAVADTRGLVHLPPYRTTPPEPPP